MSATKRFRRRLTSQGDVNRALRGYRSQSRQLMCGGGL